MWLKHHKQEVTRNNSAVTLIKIINKKIEKIYEDDKMKIFATDNDEVSTTMQCIIRPPLTRTLAKQAPPTAFAATLHHCIYIRVRHHSSPGTSDRVPNKSPT